MYTSSIYKRLDQGLVSVTFQFLGSYFLVKKLIFLKSSWIFIEENVNLASFPVWYVSMALCMGDHRVGDTSGQLAKPQEMGLARRGFTSGASSPS